MARPGFTLWTLADNKQVGTARKHLHLTNHRSFVGAIFIISVSYIPSVVSGAVYFLVVYIRSLVTELITYTAIVLSMEPYSRPPQSGTSEHAACSCVDDG